MNKEWLWILVCTASLFHKSLTIINLIPDVAIVCKYVTAMGLVLDASRTAIVQK